MAMVTNSRGQFQCIIDTAVGEQNNEIVTCQPRRNRVLRQLTFYYLRESFDNFVAGITAKGVIDQLRIVNIEINKLVFVV